MSAIAVRPAASADLGRVAELAGQLGYPSTRAEIEARHAVLSSDPERILVVATTPDGRIVGWLEFGMRDSFLSGRHAEIAGLVVDAAVRRQGVGRTLVAWAESEARRRGAARLRLTSNSQRVEAGSFYPSLGFTQTKLSRVYEKSLASPGGA